MTSGATENANGSVTVIEEGDHRRTGRNWLPIPAAAALIVLAGLIAYWNSFQGAFVFDDVDWIVKNPTIRQLWPIGPVLLPPLPGATVEGRPLLNLSFAINYALGGLNPWGYHAGNLAIHLLASLALFGAVRRAFMLSPCTKRARNDPTNVALVAALLWVVHPLNTESVTYVVQRAESLAGMFYFLTLYFSIRSFGDRNSNLWGGLAVAACVFGVASKETVATAPFLVLLYDGIVLSQSFRLAFVRRRYFYLSMTVPLMVIALLVLKTGSHGGTVGFGLGTSSLSYARIQLVAIVHYLRLGFWPAPLVFDYGVVESGDLWREIPCALAILLV